MTKRKSISLALNCDPHRSCGGKAPNGSDCERTRTIAVLQDQGDLGDLIVPITDVNKVYWDADLTSSIHVESREKRSGRMQ
jgi:hypothetical protein